MAEAESGGGGVLMAVVAYSIAAVTAVVSGVSKAVMRDGTVAAAWRQGADELGVALKAFPESIQSSEPGSILNPTQGEIASSRKIQSSHGTSMLTPSQIARDKGPYGSATAHGHEHAPKSPSEIARDKGPVQQHGQERAQAHSQGRE
jgi:hypothetical protein